MANVLYPWNPFQDQIDCDIPGPGEQPEILKLSGDNNRKEFVPRYAPFFAHGFVLRRQGDPDPLKLNVDYAFAHSFDRFIEKYNRNVFGSVVTLKDFSNEVLVIDKYSTIGGPFTMNEVAFAQLVANIVNAPRIIDWEDLDETTVPTEWPQDPHDHPAIQSYDYFDMMVQLRGLIAMELQALQDVNLKTLFQEHINAPLAQAHPGGKADFGLALTQNVGQATNADLQGGSNNLNVTVGVLKEAFRLAAQSKLPL